MLFFGEILCFLDNQPRQAAPLESRMNHKGLEVGIICDRNKVLLRYNLSVCVGSFNEAKGSSLRKEKSSISHLPSVPLPPLQFML